ncbi:hypothetical protein DKP78_18000, partial [Enterococcus faecium]
MFQRTATYSSIYSGLGPHGFPSSRFLWKRIPPFPRGKCTCKPGYRVTPDSRADVKFVDNEELAYVMQR